MTNWVCWCQVNAEFGLEVNFFCGAASNMISTDRKYVCVYKNVY